MQHAPNGPSDIKAWATATYAAPNLESPLTSYPTLPEHLEPIVEAWMTMQGLEGGIRPSDIVAHLDAVGVESPSERRRIYFGVMVLEGKSRQHRAQAIQRAK